MNSPPPIFILCLSNLFDSVIPSMNGIFKFINLEEVEKFSASIQGIIATPWTKVEGELLNKLPNLKVISCFGTGTDNINKQIACDRNIIVTNTPDVVTEDTADVALALLLALARNVVYNDHFVRSSQWQHSPAILGTSIFGKTVGILGLGKIGVRIADRALAFGLHVVYHSRTQKNVPFHYYDNVSDMAKVTDFLVVSCTGDKQTSGIIDLSVLTSLGQKGYLINVSRGITVNEEDLIFALRNKIIAGAGLDVYQNEPNIKK